jgi:hypothetical protein
MPFEARVVRVLIASPSDTVNERQVIRGAIHDWNGVNGEQGVMLLPLMWERDATPEMGDRPQGVINRQLVDPADMLIGVFWTRLGTPTSEADSGTVEEVERCIEMGKPVLLYFSSKPVHPDSVKPDEFARLKSAQQDFEKGGLVGRFESEEELYRSVIAALTATIRKHFASSLTEAEVFSSAEDMGGSPRAVILARIQREREIRGFSRSGNPQYTTRMRLVIENTGMATAENLTLSVDVPEGKNPPIIGKDEGPIRQLPPGGAIDYPLMIAFGTASQWDIVFRWDEGGIEHESRQTIA